MHLERSPYYVAHEPHEEATESPMPKGVSPAELVPGDSYDIHFLLDTIEEDIVQRPVRVEAVKTKRGISWVKFYLLDQEQQPTSKKPATMPFRPDGSIVTKRTRETHLITRTQEIRINEACFTESHPEQAVGTMAVAAASTN